MAWAIKPVNHTLVCGKAVDARGLHGLSCRRSAPRQQRHSHLNDILWRAIKRAQMPVVKELISLMRDDNKRPDGTTLLPWARGKPMAWDVTVPDTYAESHIGNTATKSGAAAQKNSTEQDRQILQIGQYTHLVFSSVARFQRGGGLCRASMVGPFDFKPQSLKLRVSSKLFNVYDLHRVP